MIKLGKLAIVYKMTLYYNFERYIYIGSTMDLQKEKEELIEKLNKNKHSNEFLQIAFNKVKDISEKSNEPLGTNIQFKTLQSLRPEYYPNNVLPMVLKELEKNFINRAYEDYKAKNKEYLLINEVQKISAIG